MMVDAAYQSVTTISAKGQSMQDMLKKDQCAGFNPSQLPSFVDVFGRLATMCCVLTYPSGIPQGQQLDSRQSDILAHAVLLAAFVRKKGSGGPGAPLGPPLLQPVRGPAVLQLVVQLLGLSRCCSSLSLSLHSIVTHKQVFK